MDDRRKNYRAWDAQQCSQQSVSPQDALPEDDLVFFLLDTVAHLDLSAFHRHYADETRGQPPFDVTMMVTLLVYAYCIGVCSSRKIAAACERNLAFRAIVGKAPPDFRTISDFRKIHLAAMKPLFLEVLRLAGEMGLVKLGNLSTDGTKIGANASRHKAMSYGYMKKDIERLEAEIDQLLKQAEQVDAEQDAALGSRRGDELPDELKRREDRLAKIRQAKARLEAEARVKAQGGTLLSGVSKRLAYLVVGDAPGSKLKKAQELGITVLDEAQFLALVDGGAAPRGRAAAIALAGEVARDHDQEREGARACGEPRGAGVARAVEDGAAGADGRGAAHRGHPAVLGAERASIDFAILRGPWP